MLQWGWVDHFQQQKEQSQANSRRTEAVFALQCYNPQLQWSLCSTERKYLVMLIFSQILAFDED